MRLFVLELLDDDGRGAATAVADGRNADLARLEEVGECDDDAAARGADGVAERDTATGHVDLADVDAQELGVDEHDRREGLVDLVQRDVAVGQAGALEGLGDRDGGGRGEVDGVVGAVSVAEDAGKRLEAELLGLLCARDDHGRGAVVELGGVGGGDGAFTLLLLLLKLIS